MKTYNVALNNKHDKILNILNDIDYSRLKIEIVWGVEMQLFLYYVDVW